MCIYTLLRAVGGIQKTAGAVAPSTLIWRGCSDHLLFFITHTNTQAERMHTHTHTHNPKALDMNEAALCPNCTFVTSHASYPLPPCKQWTSVAPVTCATSICELVIVLIRAPHAEPLSHVSSAPRVCMCTLLLVDWVGWVHSFLPNSRTACRTRVRVFVCERAKGARGS